MSTSGWSPCLPSHFNSISCLIKTCINMNNTSNCLQTWVCRLESFCLTGKHKTRFYKDKDTKGRQVIISPVPSHKERGSLPFSLQLLASWAEAVRTQELTVLLLNKEVKYNCASHSYMDELGCTQGTNACRSRSMWYCFVDPHKNRCAFHWRTSRLCLCPPTRFYSHYFSVSIARIFLDLLNQ